MESHRRRAGNAMEAGSRLQEMRAHSGVMNQETRLVDSQTAGQTCCPIVELRQYTLCPGQRDRLIDLSFRDGPSFEACRAALARCDVPNVSEEANATVRYSPE